MADDDFCVHHLIGQVRDVVTSSPRDPAETSVSDQFQTAVADLMGDLLHEAPTPEQLEGGVSALWIASHRLDAFVAKGLLSESALELGKLALAEVMTALCETYKAPPTMTAADFERMYGVEVKPRA